MNVIIKNSIRFIILLFIQVLVLNHIEIGWGIQLMIYPLFIALLPVEINIFLSLLLAFVLGMSIDVLSNTYGLHASSLLIVAYLRPLIYKISAPRDGYEGVQETNIHEMGFAWFLRAFGLLMVVHHFWFFLLEMFKVNEILYILQKTLLSAPLSFVLCILLQYLFIRKRKEREV